MKIFGGFTVVIKVKSVCLAARTKWQLALKDLEDVKSSVLYSLEIQRILLRSRGACICVLFKAFNLLFNVNKQNVALLKETRSFRQNSCDK